jgi:hypothetical protein
MSDDEKDDVDNNEEEEKEEEGTKKKPTGFPLPKDKPRFEVKKWQAVTLWSWGMSHFIFKHFANL